MMIKACCPAYGRHQTGEYCSSSVGPAYGAVEENYNYHGSVYIKLSFQGYSTDDGKTSKVVGRLRHVTNGLVIKRDRVVEFASEVFK